MGQKVRRECRIVGVGNDRISLQTQVLFCHSAVIESVAGVPTIGVVYALLVVVLCRLYYLEAKLPIPARFKDTPSNQRAHRGNTLDICYSNGGIRSPDSLRIDGTFTTITPLFRAQ